MKEAENEAPVASKALTPTRQKELTSAIKKAVESTEKARRDVAVMNAEVTTFWKTETCWPAMSADDCDRAMQLASNLVRHLSYRFRESTSVVNGGKL